MAYLTNEFPEHISHLALVCGWSIASTLWHDGPFIEAPWCLYSCEVHVIRMYSGLEEGICHVHLAKYFPFPAVGKYVINAGEGEVVLHCVAVKHHDSHLSTEGQQSDLVHLQGIWEHRMPVRHIQRKMVIGIQPSGGHQVIFSKIPGISLVLHIPCHC